jgi:hypothetical protein
MLERMPDDADDDPLINAEARRVPSDARGRIIDTAYLGATATAR